MSDAPKNLFSDYLPDDHEYLTYIKKVLRHRFRQAGFRRLSPSIIMPFEDVSKALGGDDIVDKVAFEVDGNDGERAVVRFEPLISLARAYTANDMKDLPQPVELYFIDGFLRKSANGDLNKEFDFGVQVIGATDAALTAQIIYLGFKILDDLGLREHYTVQINHIGSEESRKVYLEDLKNFYYDKQRSMTDEAIQDYERGDLLKLLRNEDEDMQILAQLAPKLENYLSKDDQKEYEQLKGYLEELGVSYRENKNLFGNGHFNAQTVFEFWHNDKGAKGAILAGGSNDQLIESLGGEVTNMIGFTCNASVVIKGMCDASIRVPHKDHLQVFVAQLGTNAKKKALSLLQELRENGIQAVGAMGTGSMRTQLDMATNFGVKYSLLLGEVEVKEGMVIARDMEAGTQESIPLSKAVKIMQERIGKEKMDLMEEKEKSADLK